MVNPPKKVFQSIPLEVESVGKTVLDAAFKVHTVLGPGLLESVYKTTMTHVLRKSGAMVDTEVVLPIMLKTSASSRDCAWICASISVSSSN